MKKIFALGILALLTGHCLSGDKASKAREREYFKAPDYWELTLGDQKDYIESQVEKYCAKNKLDSQKLEYVCGIASSLEKVFKNKYWFKGKVAGKVELSMAANEREAVQIAVIPLLAKDLKSVNIAVSELKDDKGNALPASSVKIYNVCYIKTIENPAYPVPRGREWPDPLVPARPVNIPKDECRAFWLELRTPSTAKAGVYRGRITVSGSNIQKYELDISVKVWPFALPEKQIVETCTWLSRAKNIGKTTEEKIREYRKYCEYFLDYKINPLGLGRNFYDKNDYSAVLKNLDWGVEKGLMRFQIPRLKGEELKNFCNALRQRKFFDKAMIYGYKDEPHPRDYEAFKKDSDEIRQTEPGLKIFMAETPHPGLYDAVDVWWASMAEGEDERIREQLSAGKEVWWYRCGIPVRLEYDLPHYYYPESIVVDRASLDVRIFYTMIWKFKMTPATFFYAGFCTQPAKFDKEKLEWEANKGLWSGDGFVVYSFENSIIPSTRLKCIADGIEDFEYLHILKETLKDFPGNADADAAKRLLEIPNTLMIYPYYYNRDPKALLNFREELGNLISKLKTH